MIADQTPELRHTLRDFAAQWAPSAFPSTIAAAELAETLISNLGKTPENVVKGVFQLCEEGLRESSAKDNADIATFLEALQNAADRGDFDFATIVEFLGPASKEYCRGMDRFYGSTTAGL
ncbi:DUF7674 family protein [Mesorhizobium sp. P5_C1]